MTHLLIRMPSSSRRALTPMAVLALALVSGCGSHDDPPADADAALAPAVAPEPEPTGPYDQDHRDAAIAFAKQALRKRLGEVSLRQPEAEYQHTHVQAQLPGQPASPQVVGWMVSFLVVPGSDAPPVNAIDPQAQPGPSPVDTPDAARSVPEITLGSQTPPIQAPANAGQPPDPTTQPAMVPQVQPSPTAQMTPMIQPGAGNSLTTSRQGIFVQVDGTLSAL